MVKYIYTLGAAGERLKVEELDRTVEYTYDSLYRLTSETITEGDKVTSYTYAYDNVSNRILKTENGRETAYVYNELNQLVSDSDTTYEYDLNGNLVRIVGSAHSALYEYNAKNKLVKATVQNGNVVIEETYTYDYAGNRTSKTTRTSNGKVEYTRYLNDTNSELTNVLCELDETDAAKCVYVIGADLISQERDGKVSVYIYDGHGSVTALANENGKVTDTYRYDAFGNLLNSTGSTENCYRYCGEQFDETTGLYYLRARYMDTSTGRFISQDSYQGDINDPISLHKYLYANSNPVTYSDPSGYISVADVSISGAIVGVLSSAALSGIINVGISLIRDIKGDTPQETSYYISIFLEAFVDGVLTAAFFTACGILAACLSSTAIVFALGVSSVLMSAAIFGAAIAAGQAGEDEIAAIYILLGIAGLVAADACFSNAAAISSAKRTTGSTTNSSTSNTQTATNASGNSNSYDIVKNNAPDLKDVNIDKFTIKNKHLNTSGGGWKKFNVATEQEAMSIVKNAIENGEVVSTVDNGLGSQGQKSYKTIIETGQVIGAKGETQVQIVYDEFENVWTVYPR